MGRRGKIAITVLVALAALLALNTLLVDGETEKAEVNEPGGRILDLPEGELQVTEHGPRNGSPIVLIHCFSCAINWWDGVMPMLDRKHRVIAVDLLGHGGSEKPDGGYTIPHQAEVIAKALERLHVKGAEIVGHSLGGTVAVALAERHRFLASRVVIIDTAAGHHSRGSLGFIAGLAFEPVIGEALWRIKPDFATKKGLAVAFAPGFDVPDEFVEDVNRMTYTAYDESPEGSSDYVDEETLDERMRSTGLPLMVLMGEEEQIVDDPVAALAEYEHGVPGVETHLIAGAGHSPNVEKPRETAKLLLSFGEKSVGSSADRASGVRRGAAGKQ
ncbi:MAG TPA: alpha/beta fold hydrolase [Solirubrobacterales bacterium]|nr:alpha/beta fold hydrolase [Solirubrobacterales bacterium]